jgi:geranylgeranyl reductase family protein
MSRRDDADVLVVGAGPAGAWTARCLARAGARVRVFDHSHPREKPCGGGVTGRALALVRSAVSCAELDAVSIDGGVFQDPRTDPARVSLDASTSTDASLVVVRRRTFDGALLRAAREAGAELHDERVLDAAVDGGSARVRTAARAYEGRWLVGADGANSLVRRRLSAPFTRRHLSIAAGVYAHDQTDREILVHFLSRPAGYIWSFPRRDHLAIGACAQADEASATDVRRAFDDWLSGWNGLRPGRLERYAWPIPSLAPADLSAEWPAGPGYLLAGDAAGLVDPITREGIFFALLSGQLAADALGAPGDPAPGYVAALRRHIYPELIRAARLKRGFFRGPFTRLLVDALRRSAAVRAVMVDLVAGAQPYQGLKSRLLRTFEWRLAWELLRLQTGSP